MAFPQNPNLIQVDPTAEPQVTTRNSLGHRFQNNISEGVSHSLSSLTLDLKKN